MKRHASALLLALGASLAGCAATVTPAPRSIAADGAAADVGIAATNAKPASLAATGATSALEATTATNVLEAFVDPSRLAPTPAAAPACRAETAKGFTGFYATDVWERGEVVLTFDDGPHPKGTPRVLDLLARHAMPATFFVVGRNIDRTTYPLIQRMVAEGHTLGTHSYSHDVHMTRVHAPDATHDDVVGQHRVTTMLIDLALLATSGDDFDAMFAEVFASPPAIWLSSRTIREHHATFAVRHADLLARRGFAAGSRPHDVLYSRPPGGGPYVEHDGAAGMKLHDRALAELSLVNVMWHDASGDTVPGQRSDLAFLTGNMARAAANGGVLLVHDYIRPDALAHALAAMAGSDAVRVIPIERAVEHKFGCSSRDLAASLRGAPSHDAAPAARASR